MKNLGLLLSLTILFNQCMVEKRLYNKGWNINWKHRVSQSTESSNELSREVSSLRNEESVPLGNDSLSVPRDKINSSKEQSNLVSENINNSETKLFPHSKFVTMKHFIHQRITKVKIQNDRQSSPQYSAVGDGFGLFVVGTLVFLGICATIGLFASVSASLTPLLTLGLTMVVGFLTLVFIVIFVVKLSTSYK